MVRPLHELLDELQSLPDDDCEIEADPDQEDTNEDVTECEATLDTGLHDAEVDQEKAENVQSGLITDVLPVEHRVLPLVLDTRVTQHK